MPAGNATVDTLSSYIEALPEPHILFGRDYRILAANAAYREQYASGGDVVGRTCHAVSHRSDVPCDQAGESCPLAVARRSAHREKVVHLHHVGNGQEYVEVELTPVRDADGQIAYFIERMEPLRIATQEETDRSLVGSAPAFRAMLELVARVGETDASVLLLGESGTGKELVAQALHEIGARRARPFVVVECSSFAETLFESELFGHEKGAFTGAVSMRKGLVETADGGTLFLDEVGDIPLSMQVKLLRLIETGCYRRVGGTELRHTDLRIVSATHRDLRAMVARGAFRQDLFYRLGIFPIRIPPLRERMDDLESLCRALLRRMRGASSLRLTPGALERLRHHDFPGNVRELRNVLERAAIMADGGTLGVEHIEFALTGLDQAAATPPRPADAEDAVSDTLRHAESDLLQAALAAHRGSRRALAARLGISERTLYRRLKALERGD